MSGRWPEAKDKTIAAVLFDAAVEGGDVSAFLAYRATKAESLLRQIACNTDPVWARKLACDFYGIDPPEDQTVVRDSTAPIFIECLRCYPRCYRELGHPRDDAMKKAPAP